MRIILLVNLAFASNLVFAAGITELASKQRHLPNVVPETVTGITPWDLHNIVPDRVIPLRDIPALEIPAIEIQNRVPTTLIDELMIPTLIIPDYEVRERKPPINE